MVHVLRGLPYLEELADSFDDINWEEQAARPDLDALGYADSMEPRTRRHLHHDKQQISTRTAGAMSAVVAMVRNHPSLRSICSQQEAKRVLRL